MRNETIEKYCNLMADYIASDLKDAHRSFIFTPIDSYDFNVMFSAISDEAKKRGNGYIEGICKVSHPDVAISSCSCVIEAEIATNGRQWRIEFCHYAANNSKAIRASLVN